MTTTIKYYKHQDNKINDDYFKIGNSYFKIKNVSFIGDTSSSYIDGIKILSFNIICDGKSYDITVDKDQKDLLNKIHESIISYTFPKQDGKDREKKYI